MPPVAAVNVPISLFWGTPIPFLDASWVKPLTYVRIVIVSVSVGLVRLVCCTCIAKTGVEKQ